MKTKPYTLYLSLLLVLCSVLLYSIHYLLFHDLYFVKIYLLDHLAFVPIEVLLVTIIIGNLLSYREKNNRLEKMDMVIGNFYSEVGRELLILLSLADKSADSKQALLKNMHAWSKRDFSNITRQIQAADSQVHCSQSVLPQLKELLVSRREFLLHLMENPNLLEHDKFTNLMQAVFHLLEELQFHSAFDTLPQADYAHLSRDAKRAYTPLLMQWIDHMSYLRQNYPYLFSLAARTNPFNPDASVFVEDQ